MTFLTAVYLFFIKVLQTVTPTSESRFYAECVTNSDVKIKKMFVYMYNVLLVYHTIRLQYCVFNVQ